MRQWDIYQFPFPTEEKPHPFVVLSPDSLLQDPNADHINGLICVSQRADKRPKDSDVVLDEADGLEWKTLVGCRIVWRLPKAAEQRRRGCVSIERRRLIGATLGKFIGLR